MEKGNEGEMIMRHIVGCGLVIMLLSFSGCANTQPTHFYLLRAMETNDSFAMEVAKNSALSLGVGPISLPKYLDRPHIVTRISAHEINLAEFHKWGAPLKDNLSNVLLENLSRLLSTNQIVKYPWNRSHLPDYQLSLEVTQFDGAKNQEATLRVRWRLAADDGKRVLEEKTSQFSEVIRGSGYEDLVEAMSRMLATFSQEIADVLNRPPRLL